jgi:hypothetical protein
MARSGLSSPQLLGRCSGNKHGPTCIPAVLYDTLPRTWCLRSATPVAPGTMRAQSLLGFTQDLVGRNAFGDFHLDSRMVRRI